jgi:serine/threonine protein kinase
MGYFSWKKVNNTPIFLLLLLDWQKSADLKQFENIGPLPIGQKLSYEFITGYLYIAMELCSKDLKQYITEMPIPRDRRKLLEIFKEICNGLYYMHHVQKTFHR